MTRCLAPDCQMGGLGCDNMTVVLVCILNGESYEKLAERCKLVPLPLSQTSNSSYINNYNNNINNNNSSSNSTLSPIPKDCIYDKEVESAVNE